LATISGHWHFDSISNRYTSIHSLCLSVSLSFRQSVSTFLLYLSFPPSLRLPLCVSVSSSLRLTIYPSVHLPVSPFIPFSHYISLSYRLSIFRSFYLSVCPFVHHSVCPSVHLSVSFYVSSPVCLSICLIVCQSIFPSVCHIVSKSLRLSLSFHLLLSTNYHHLQLVALGSYSPSLPLLSSCCLESG